MLLRLDRDPNVTDYGSQPERFNYVDSEGKPRTYTPDFKVWQLEGGIEIHEVTMSIRRREQAAREICQARGWRYVIHTERSLPQPTELTNLLALFHYRPRGYANQQVARVAFEQLGHAEQGASILAVMADIAQELNLP